MGASRWARRVRGVADLPARLALGGAMLYHGLGKLRGEGPEQAGAYFESLGLHPGRRWAVATGWAECSAGVLAILGIGTRPAALAVLTTQAVAAWKVHRPKGYDIMKGGLEYNLALMSIAAGLLLEGPHVVSASHAVRRAALRRGTPRWPRWPRSAPSAIERALGAIN